MLNKSGTCQLETGSYGNSSKVTSDTDIVSFLVKVNINSLYNF